MAPRDEAGFFRSRKVFFLSTQTVEDKAPIFLGHYLIAMAACMMYSPFVAQTVLGLIYILIFLCMFTFMAWKYERWFFLSVSGTSYLMEPFIYSTWCW